MSTTSFTKTTQPLHDAPSTRLNEGAPDKEVRAHEHARHRTKERRDHALAMERKEKASTMRVLGLKVPHGAKLVRKLSMESWDGEEPPEEPLSATAASPTQDVGPGTPVRAHSEHENGQVQVQECDAAPPRASTSSFTLLTLGDLISKPRRPKAKQLDFEVIPPLPAVIALDDDEPWEYITRASLSDGPTWKGKSYAQAVASAM